MATEYKDYMRPPTDTISISSNGEVNVTEYGTANVNVQPSLQTKSVTYTTNGTNTITKDSGYDGMTSVQVNVNVPSAQLQSKSKTISSNGTTVISPDSGYDGLSSATVTVSVPSAQLQSKSVTYASNGSATVTPDSGYDGLSRVSVNVNVASSSTQAYIGYARCSTTTLSSTTVKLTVSSSGTYTVSWLGCRSYSSGTFGSQLYIGSSAYGSENTSFTNTYFQSNKLTGVSLSAGQTITVYARSSSTSRYMFVGNLIIEKTS